MVILANMSPVPDSQEFTHKLSKKNDVYQTFENVWNEYSSWSVNESKDTLQSLRRPARRPPKLAERMEGPEPRSNQSHSLETCIIVDYDVDDPSAGLIFASSTKKHSMDTYVLSVENPLVPYPPYTSCASTSQNILTGDDSHYMPFLPFSDDPSYNHKYEFELYHYVAWQRPFITSDLEIILLQSTKRLLLEHKLSCSEIDDTKVFPNDTASILDVVRKRDLPAWPSHWMHPNIKPIHAVGADNITRYFLSYFCSSLNCLTGFCAMHDPLSVEEHTPTPNVMPKLAADTLISMIEKPCGKDCVLAPPTSFNTSGIIWTEQEKQILTLTIGYAPDTLPCDIAVICRKPCREVYQFQKQHSAAKHHPHKTSSKQPHLKLSSFEDASPGEFTPNDPCRHKGPCGPSSDCACFRNKAHCHTRCGCSKSCARRWKGCSCAKSENGGVCGTRKCSCFRAHIECDPDICKPCGARDINSKSCQNVGIQRGNFKELEVRESQWGLGLFLAEPCDVGELVGEYVGEMIYDPTVTSRNLQAIHKSRSYVFGLNPTFSLDSAYVGNEMRYMNHSYDPNCSTKVLRVNGSHRIGVYAAVPLKEGDELLINYGPGFWEPHINPGNQGLYFSATQSTMHSLETLDLPPIYDDPNDPTYIE